MKSSYKKNNYRQIFRDLAHDKKFIVEFGILDGYSLKAFADTGNKVFGIDLFENYQYNRADYWDIVQKFKDYSNVYFSHGDFYKAFHWFRDESIDLLHIDISNDADVYEFAINHYWKKVRKDGLMILEGGSEERDNVEWMKKYNKKPINSYLKSLSLKYKIIEKYPSITIFKKD